MNTTGNTIQTMQPQELELGKVEQHIPKVPVSDTLPRYHQTLSYSGCKLCLITAPVELHALLYSSKALYGDSVLVPVSDRLRHQFEMINDFVRNTVLIPNELSLQWSASLSCYYKPIYEGKNIFISLSKFCRFTQEVNGRVMDLPSQPRPNLGVGRYVFTIDVPYVYIGPHKSGHLYTTHLCVTRIHFLPAVSHVSSPLVQPNYGMPVSQSMAVSQLIEMTQPLHASQLMDINQPRQVTSPMDIPPEKPTVMAGILPSDATKSKRRRKTAVITE